MEKRVKILLVKKTIFLNSQTKKNKKITINQITKNQKENKNVKNERN
jgi:hypothetical protein